MNHLRILTILNWVSVVILALVAVLIVGTTALTVWLVIEQDPEALPVLAPTLLLNGLVLVLLACMVAPLVVAARGLQRGRGRVAQTLVAVLSVSSIPLGTAFAAYSVWACWIHPETRERFEGSKPNWLLVGAAAAVPIALVVGLVGVSVPPLFPTDVAALDARWEPVEDRSGRVEGEGCGLTELPEGQGCAPAQPSGVRVEEITFATRAEVMGFTELAGTLHLPEGLPGRRPAVVLVHGSGPSNRHGDAPGELVRSVYRERLPVFDVLAEELSARGMVVLQYDKRACAKCYPGRYGPDTDFSTFRFQLFIDDALAAVDYLADRPEVDDRAVVVVGHSQGASLAPHIAAADERVAAVVMLAGFAGTFAETVVGQLEDLAAVRAERWDWLTAWALHLQADHYRQCTDRIQGDYDPGDTCLGGGVTLAALAEYEELNRTTLEVVAGLEVPLFALAGTADLNVSPDHLLRIREAAIGRDAELHLVPGVGHGLRDLVEPTSPPELSREVLDRLTTFLASVKRPEHAPIPYTLAQLREAHPDGTVKVFSMHSAGQDPTLRRFSYSSPDEAGVTVQLTVTDPDGEVLLDDEPTRTPWTELRDHARYPREGTTIAPEEVEVPGGRFVARR